MSSTSIHIEPIKCNCEAHNLSPNYRATLDYVRHELTQNNETIIFNHVSDALENIKQRYYKTTGQRLQTKATPIREGVLVINKNTTKEQILAFCKRCEDTFHIKPLSIAIHRDEGHIHAKKWNPNLHAHIIWDWTDQETGKTIKLNKQDMAKIQDFASNCLLMERGKKSSKRHLSVLQYKVQKQEEHIKELRNTIKLLETSKDIKQAISAFFTKQKPTALEKEQAQVIEILKRELDNYKAVYNNLQIKQRESSKIENNLRDEIAKLTRQNRAYYEKYEQPRMIKKDLSRGI